MTPFYISSWGFKIGIKNFILDLNRTQMFSEQLLKMTGALQRRCLPVSVIRHLREEQRSVCNYFGIQATWVSLRSFLYFSIAVAMIGPMLFGNVSDH